MYIFSECEGTYPDWYKDGYCDEKTNMNTESCNYDGGDCCDPDANYTTAPICGATNIVDCCIDPDDPRNPINFN